jgi:hypothetical protein
MDRDYDMKKITRARHKKEDRLNFEICAVLGFYTVNNGNSIPTFRDTLLALSSRVMQYSWSA